jgi:hypothetical protein
MRLADASGTVIDTTGGTTHGSKEERPWHTTIWLAKNDLPAG